MLRTNEISDHIQACVNRKHYDFCIQSIDANADGTKVVLTGIYEDPDFPEIFIYNEKTGKSRKINSEGYLIDFPIGKVFWAENNRDIYINRHDCELIYLVKIDTKSYKIVSFIEIPAGNSYIERKLKEVTDFIFYHNNYQPAEPQKIYENEWHELSANILNGIRWRMDNLIELERFIKASEDMRNNQFKPKFFILSGLYGIFKEMQAQKSNLNIDLSDIEMMHERLLKLALESN